MLPVLPQVSATQAISLLHWHSIPSGTLFAMVGDKKTSTGGGLAPETLFTLNTSSAAPTQILVLGRGNDGEAIGFNPNDGLLYHASGNDTGGDGCQPFNPSICVEIFESINPIPLQ